MFYHRFQRDRPHIKVRDGKRAVAPECRTCLGPLTLSLQHTQLGLSKRPQVTVPVPCPLSACGSCLPHTDPVGRWSCPGALPLASDPVASEARCWSGVAINAMTHVETAGVGTGQPTAAQPPPRRPQRAKTPGARWTQTERALCAEPRAGRRGEANISRPQAYRSH